MLKKLTAIIQRIIDAIRRKRKSHEPWGDGIDPARAGGNAASAIAKIKRATHPQFRDRAGRSQHLVPGTHREGGQWGIASPWHGGLLIGGYYIVEKRGCYTVCNPANPADYLDSTQAHETAHDLESQLGIAPPWHYHAWRHLFRNWINVTAQPILNATRVNLQDAILQLPGVEPGDHVEIDLIGGLHLTAKASGVRARPASPSSLSPSPASPSSPSPSLPPESAPTKTA